MKTPDNDIRRNLPGLASDPKRPPVTPRSFPMRLKAGRGLKKPSAFEAEMEAEAHLDVTRWLMDEHAIPVFPAEPV